MSSSPTPQNALVLPVQRIPIEVEGSVFWLILHMVSYNFPDQPTEQEQQAAKEFVSFCMIHFLGPLCSCKDHMVQYLELNPVNVASRSAFFMWTVDFHNTVSARLGKKQTVSYAEAAQTYHQMAQSQSSKFLTLPKQSKLLYVVMGDEYYSLVKGSIGTLGVLFASYVVYRIWKSLNRSSSE